MQFSIRDCVTVNSGEGDSKALLNAEIGDSSLRPQRPLLQNAKWHLLWCFPSLREIKPNQGNVSFSPLCPFIKLWADAHLVNRSHIVEGAHSSPALWPLPPPQHTAGPFQNTTHFSAATLCFWLTMQPRLSKPPRSNVLISTKHTVLIILFTRQVQQHEGGHWYSGGCFTALAYQVFVCLLRPLYPPQQIKGMSTSSVASHREGSYMQTAEICKSGMSSLQHSWKAETWGIHHEFILVRRRVSSIECFELVLLLFWTATWGHDVEISHSLER